MCTISIFSTCMLSNVLHIHVYNVWYITIAIIIIFCTVFLNNQVSHQSCEVDNILYLSNVCLLSELSIQLSVMMCQFPTAFCTITHSHIHCTVHAHHPFNFLIVVHIPVHECSIIILLVNAPTY